MLVSRRFIRVAAACSFVSVATTLALIFLPRFYPPVGGLEERLLLTQTMTYQVRAWVYLLHPFVVMSAGLGVAATSLDRSAGATVVGVVGLFVWALTEAGQQALTLVAYHAWAAEFLSGDAAARLDMAQRIAIYDGVWNAMFLLLLLGFLIGNLGFGVALLGGPGLDRVLSALFFGVAGLTVFNISGHLGGPVLPGPIASWAYPVVQPGARFLIGVYLLTTARETVGTRVLAASDA